MRTVVGLILLTVAGLASAQGPRDRGNDAQFRNDKNVRAETNVRIDRNVQIDRNVRVENWRQPERVDYQVRPIVVRRVEPVIQVDTQYCPAPVVVSTGYDYNVVADLRAQIANLWAEYDALAAGPEYPTRHFKARAIQEKIEALKIRLQDIRCAS